MVYHRSVLVFQTCVRKIRHSTHVAICTSVIPEQIVETRSPTSDTCHKLIGLLKEVRFSGSYALLSNVFFPVKLNSLRSGFMYENSIASLNNSKTSEEKARPYDALLSVKTPTRSRYLWVNFTETKKVSFCGLQHVSQTGNT